MEKKACKTGFSVNHSKEKIMFCEKCGAELPIDAVFCPKCGKKIETVNFREQDSGELVHVTEMAAPVPNPFDGERMNFDIPICTPEKSGRGKGPVIIVVGLLIALVAAIILFFASVFGKESAKETVKAAIQKTVQILEEEAKTVNPYIGVDQFGYSFEVTIYQQEEMGDIRVSASGNIDQSEKDTKGSIQIGVGDMKDIQIDYLSEKDGMYLNLPDLYSKTILISEELLGDSTNSDGNERYNQEAAREALASLEKTLGSIYNELFQVNCKKMGKKRLAEHMDIEARQYELTVSAADYMTYIREFPDRLEQDKVFINWLAELTSQWQVDELLDSIRQAANNYEVDKDVDRILLGYVYVDKEGRMVQLEIPFEDGIKGELILSFLGKERLSDSVCVNFHAKNKDSKTKMEFLYKKQDEHLTCSFQLIDNGDEILMLEMSGTSQLTGDIYTFQADNFKLEFDEGLERIEGDFSYQFSPMIQTAKMDKNNCLIISEEYTEELDMAVIEILQNMSKGGYIPSQYIDELNELIYLITPSDTDNSYSENDEYSIWSYDLKYSENGNPILINDTGEYQIELIAPIGAELELDWSSPGYIEYTAEKGALQFDYQITYDTEDRFFYEKSYLTGDTYENIVYSDIMQKEINGYPVYYQYCSYDYSYATGCKIYYAWIYLDEENVFQLHLIDFTNTVEDDILDGCFQSVLPVQ